MVSKSIYDAEASDMFGLFADYLEGDAERPVIVVSSHPLAQPARIAIEKSLAAIDYGDEACTYATLADSLDPQALFLLIEGIDPQKVICTDTPAANRLEEAYRMTLDRDAPVRIFGRTSVAFADLEGLIGSEAGKRKAWELFKTLR